MCTLQEDNQDKGFTVLGFPCNQFGNQEPGTDEEIFEFATSKFGLNFPLFSKIEVNGGGACDLYQQLTSAQADDEGKADIAWNFTKFLVNRDGEVVKRFGPQVSPEDIAAEIGSIL